MPETCIIASQPALSEAMYYTRLHMGAVLVGTDGPSRGRLVLLGATEVSLGRHENNSVAIEDAAASKHHCVIRPCGGGFQLHDLKSRNGTFVNGVPVTDRMLEDDDEIRVGESVFRFQVRSREDHETTTLHSADSIYLNPQKLDETLPPLDRTARGVHILLRISQALQGAQTVEALQRQLIELLLEAAPAERAAIVLTGFDELAFALERGGGACPAPAIQDDIARAVLERREAVLRRPSAADGESRRIIAVPLVCFEQVEGLILLEGHRGSALLDDGHLQLVSAVGAIAGLAIRNLRRVEELRQEKQRLEEEIWIQHDMVGSSAPMREIHRFIGRVAGSDSTVLIGGESGTGKELVARAIHQNSARAEKPFIAINCAALTESLLESELFGHERGAFTGAVATKKGKFEMADGGTLFLDEVGELAPALQAKLLRVLQQQEFERVGGTRRIHVNVRILAATNRDLEAAARANAFRQDLYFRLNVISVRMPPLRERREDIPLLAGHFAKKFCERMKRAPMAISEKARAALMRYDWPGNVRELENAIERAVVLGASDSILPEDLPEAIVELAAAAPSGSVSGPGSYQAAVVEAKQRVVREALDRAGGVITEAARLLDVHPNYLHRLLRNLQLR
ncbi:MAG TPA: sigma 54-interacting transcriptional regulator [Bryobacteraceae bacterium]|nr:sigma 54-interacting transcriptional regulator [Bryobacteraceae bacterium]